MGAFKVIALDCFIFGYTQKLQNVSFSAVLVNSYIQVPSDVYIPFPSI